ncbi:hypothetical protein IDH70_04760 [Mixta calida]|nr:hypothetical protein IDH70_04760 [Mixta calida]
MDVPNETLNDFIKGNGYGVAPSAVVEMARELMALRKAFSGAPDAYVVTGGKFFKDRICRMKGEAQEALNTRKDSSYIIGLYRKPTLP